MMKKKLIGAVKVNKPFEHLKNNYECAAWWEKQEAVTGFYPVFVENCFYYPHNLKVFAEIKAIVVDDHFPPLWGGVSISDKPYLPKHLGASRTIKHSIGVLEAIESTGNSPGRNLDWYLSPKYWYLFAEEAATELEKAIERLPKNWEQFKDYQESSVKLQGDAGSLAFNGGEIEKWAKRIEKLAWKYQYHEEGNHLNSEYNRKNYLKNTHELREAFANFTLKYPDACLSGYDLWKVK